MPKPKYDAKKEFVSDENREILKVFSMPGWKYIKKAVESSKMALEAERDQILAQKGGIKGTSIDDLNFVLARLRERDLILAEFEGMEDELKPEEISPAKA